MISHGRWVITAALHERHWIFGISLGEIPEIPAWGVILNLGAGGIIFGWKEDE